MGNELEPSVAEDPDCGCLVVKVTDSWLVCHEFEPNTTEDPPSARGLLVTDHVILNHGQVTWMTPELAPSSPYYHTTPTGGRFSSRQFNVHRCPTRRIFSGTVRIAEWGDVIFIHSTLSH
ncbi:hypothetical protein TNCV_948131 [Trichonephila clavipes]|nr:hypothetical protein TNCV_948131 [Trichonephila clavipes]